MGKILEKLHRNTNTKYFDKNVFNSIAIIIFKNYLNAKWKYDDKHLILSKYFFTNTFGVHDLLSLGWGCGAVANLWTIPGAFLQENTSITPVYTPIKCKCGQNRN